MADEMTHRVRAGALGEALALLRVQITAGLVKLQPKAAADRAVELARVFERFLVEPRPHQESRPPAGPSVEGDGNAATNALICASERAAADAPPAPTPDARALTHPLGLSNEATPRPLFSAGITRETLDAVRQGALGVGLVILDQHLADYGIDREQLGAILRLTEDEGQAILAAMRAQSVVSPPSAPPPADAEDPWARAALAFETAITQAGATEQRDEIVRLVCAVNHVARLEDLTPDALEAAAGEVEGLLTALENPTLVSLLRDRAGMG